MKNLIIIIFLVTFTINGFGQNLISNWKFQDDAMNIKCDGWFNGCGNELTISCDTVPYCLVGFKNEAASVIPEEVWSLQLEAGFPNEGLAETYITGQTGTQIYELKFWMKSESDISKGFASIGTISQNQFSASKTISDTAIYWKELKLIDTLTTQETDTIVVRLSAEKCDFCVRKVYFDFIEFTVIDNSSSVMNFQQNDRVDIKIYPNPSKDKITFKIDDSKHENHKITIYNTTGQILKTPETNEKTFSIDNSDISKGLYFYQVQRMADEKIIGHGKFIRE